MVVNFFNDMFCRDHFNRSSTVTAPLSIPNVRNMLGPRRGAGIWLTTAMALALVTLIGQSHTAASVACAGPIDDTIAYIEWLIRQLTENI